MIFIDEPVEAFASRWGLKIEPIRCLKCKQMLQMKIPFAMKGYRGVKADPNDHPCGDEYTPSRFRPVGETLTEWRAILGGSRE